MVREKENLDYRWFLDNQAELFKQYPDKFLIISECNILGAFDTFENAMEEALKQKKAGEFLIQYCSKDFSCIRYYNRAVSF